MPTPEELAAAATAPNDSVSTVSDPNAVRGDEPNTAPTERPEDDLSGFDAAAFVDEPDEITAVEKPAEEAPTTPSATTPAPATPTPEPAKPEPAAPVTPTTPSTATPPEQAPSAPTTAVTPSAPEETLTAEQQQEQYQAWFGSQVEQLQSVYTLTPEMAEELDREPSKVFPKLAAHLHMQIVTGATTIAANLFASMLPEWQRRSAEEASVEDKFYSKFESLKPYKAQVDQISRAVAASVRGLPADKRPSPEELMDNIGAMAHVQLRIPLPAHMQPPVITPVPAAVPPTAAAAAPAAPAAPAGQRSWLEDMLQEE